MTYEDLKKLVLNEFKLDISKCNVLEYMILEKVGLLEEFTKLNFFCITTFDNYESSKKDLSDEKGSTFAFSFNNLFEEDKEKEEKELFEKFKTALSTKVKTIPILEGSKGSSSDKFYNFILTHKECEEIVKSSSLYKAIHIAYSGLNIEELNTFKQKVEAYNVATLKLDIEKENCAAMETVVNFLINHKIDPVINFKHTDQSKAIAALKEEWLKKQTTEAKKNSFLKAFAEMEGLIYECYNGGIKTNFNAKLNETLLTLKKEIDLPTWKKIVNAIYNAIRIFCHKVANEVRDLYNEETKKTSSSTKPITTYGIFQDSFKDFKKDLNRTINENPNLHSYRAISSK